ncbi:NAD/NADP-dependent betaine aldehyde dehydrogenase [Streptomyces alboniger]
MEKMTRECGWPKDVFQVVTGAGATGQALVDTADFVMFTGSTKTGRAVAARAGERLVPCSLELGGKDALIVLADASLERAVNVTLHGALCNGGQMCTSVERVYVQEPVYDAFVARLRQRFEEVTSGRPAGLGSTDVGAMTFPPQMSIVEDHVRDAVSRGARVLVGGHAAPGIFASLTTARVVVLTTPSRTMTRNAAAMSSSRRSFAAMRDIRSTVSSRVKCSLHANRRLGRSTNFDFGHRSRWRTSRPWASDSSRWDPGRSLVDPGEDEATGGIAEDHTLLPKGPEDIPQDDVDRAGRCPPSGGDGPLDVVAGDLAQALDAVRQPPLEDRVEDMSVADDASVGAVRPVCSHLPSPRTIKGREVNLHKTQPIGTPAIKKRKTGRLWSPRRSTRTLSAQRSRHHRP